MNFKYYLIIPIILFLSNCSNNVNLKKFTTVENFSNKGFTLVFTLFRSFISIPSTGAFSATSFSSCQVLVFFAINDELFDINEIDI